MRSNQQNKNRSRGRNGGRKNVNPLSRNFESNGPDVKIRGNAAHIAERYVQLARDATASGDLVMSENYMQHAEHYFRILSAAQAQAQIQPRNEPVFDYDEDENDAVQPGSAASGNETPASTQSGAASDSDGARAEEETPEAGAAAQGEDRGERPRTRRPRRRRQNQNEESDDLSDSAQPEVGELPAFLTGGPASAAE